MAEAKMTVPEFEKLRNRAVVAADYRLNCSPHEWTDEDSLAMAKFIRCMVPGTPFDNCLEALPPSHSVAGIHNLSSTQRSSND